MTKAPRLGNSEIWPKCTCYAKSPKPANFEMVSTNHVWGSAATFLDGGGGGVGHQAVVGRPTILATKGVLARQGRQPHRSATIVVMRALFGQVAPPLLPTASGFPIVSATDAVYPPVCLTHGSAGCDACRCSTDAGNRTLHRCRKLPSSSPHAQRQAGWAQAGWPKKHPQKGRWGQAPSQHSRPKGAPRQSHSPCATHTHTHTMQPGGVCGGVVFRFSIPALTRRYDQNEMALGGQTRRNDTSLGNLVAVQGAHRRPRVA